MNNRCYTSISQKILFFFSIILSLLILVIDKPSKSNSDLNDLFVITTILYILCSIIIIIHGIIINILKKRADISNSYQAILILNIIILFITVQLFSSI